MSNTEHLKLPEWVRELRPNAIWFLLTFIGSAVGAAIVRSIPDPVAQTILIGIGLCVNALLIAWLTWLRTRDNEAAIRERKILLRRIIELQRTSEETGLQREDIGVQHREPVHLREPMPAFEHLSELEQANPDVAERLPRVTERSPRVEIGEATTSQRWGIREEDAQKQWTRLNRAEQAIVKFILLRGTVTATQLLQFRDHEGSRSTDTCDQVKSKTSFLTGDLDGGLTINPEMKPYLEKIVAQDKSRGAYF